MAKITVCRFLRIQFEPQLMSSSSNCKYNHSMNWPDCCIHVSDVTELSPPTPQFICAPTCSLSPNYPVTLNYLYTHIHRRWLLNRNWIYYCI